MKDSRILREWVDANGNQVKFNNKTSATTTKGTTADFTEKFKKLYGHIDSVWGGLNIIRCTAHTLAIYYGYGQKWYHLIIRYIPEELCFEINLSERRPSDKLIYAGEADSWTELLDILLQTETIKNRKLCEWVDAKGNKAAINTSTSTINIPTKLPETGYKEKFQKLLDYHKQHAGKDVISTEIKKLNNYGFEYREVSLAPGSTSESILIIEVDIHDDGEYFAYVWQDGKCIDLSHGDDFDILLSLLGKYLNIPNKNSNEYQKLLEWIDSKGNKSAISSQTTASSISKNTLDDFRIQYNKLCSHIHSIWGGLHIIMRTKHELDIYFGDHADRQNLIIKFVPAKNYFEIELINSYNDSQLFKGKRSDWGSVLSGLKILGVIKDKSLCEWVDSNGNKSAFNNTSSTNNANSPAGYKEKFTKLLDYHTKHLPLTAVDPKIKVLQDDEFIYKEHHVTGNAENDYDLEVAVAVNNKSDVWDVSVYKFGLLVKVDFGSGWEALLKSLKNILSIPAEGTADYQKLLEWVDANGNKTTNSGTTKQPALSSNSNEEVVYIWDMYVDPRDKGTWCSAEKNNGEYDGFVFKNKTEAYHYGADHLFELEDEGALRGDPADYTINVVAIPKTEVSEYTLRFSGL